MARLLGISVPYLSQLENDERPLTATVKAALARAFPLDWSAFDDAEEEQLLAAFNWALADPGHAIPPPDPERIERLHLQYPEFAARHVDLHHRLRRAEERLAMMEDAIGGVSPARLPWEQVQDWFHAQSNYIHDLDCAAEEAAETLALIDAIARDAALADPLAEALLRADLTGYAARAATMPYARFRAAARETRHDIDALAARFGTGIEDVCQRLATLQRPGLRGLPVFFCRVDRAGNITRRHSATRLGFARFGGSCPLWIAHEAATTPGRTHVQLAEMPDGSRTITMARGIGHHAVVLGCEKEHAASFVYADGLPLADEAAATPIGPACRLCPREGCSARAFPPADRPFRIDAESGRIVPLNG